MHFHSRLHWMRRRFAHGLFGGGGPGFGRHGWRGGMRRGRLLDHGDLRFVILQLVAEKPRYGYELIKAIEEKFGGVYTPSPGVVYPTLTLLRAWQRRGRGAGRQEALHHHCRGHRLPRRERGDRRRSLRPH